MPPFTPPPPEGCYLGASCSNPQFPAHACPISENPKNLRPTTVPHLSTEFQRQTQSTTPPLPPTVAPPRSSPIPDFCSPEPKVPHTGSRRLGPAHCVSNTRSRTLGPALHLAVRKGYRPSGHKVQQARPKREHPVNHACAKHDSSWISPVTLLP